MDEATHIPPDNENKGKIPLSEFKRTGRWMKLKKVFNTIGPGLIAGASDDDPSGITSFSQAGAGFGLTTLWAPFLVFPLMSSIQEMCARIGLVTREGLTETVIKYYPKPLSFLMTILVFPAILLNLGADIQGMGAVAHLLLPGIPSFVLSILFTLMLIFFIIRFPYQKLARVLKWLCLSLLLYAVVPFMVKTDIGAILKNIFLPAFPLSKDFISILVAVLGSGLSPYMFFWQVSIEVEDVESNSKKVVASKRVLSNIKLDVHLGIFFSCLIMFFIILTTGTVLHQAGIHHIKTVNEAASALEPLAGKLSYFLFAMGIIGTGLLAVPSLVGALSYMIAETFNLKKGLDKKFHQAPGFYLTMIFSLLLGLCLDFFGISPISALIYAAILYGLIAPVLIAIILHICNNKKIMDKHTNTPWLNFWGILSLVVMASAAIVMIVFQFIS